MNRHLTAPVLLVSANLAATALVAATAFFAAPAFASGYGPQPSYAPLVGAPESQRGQSVQTLAQTRHVERIDADGRGGTNDTRSASGAPLKTR